jgi:hypothetical protein
MKEINEEMQMRIFDLLEGNLSHAEKEALFKEIEQSKELQHEYNLMSKTYLEADAVAFVNKAELYRPKRGSVYFMPLQRYAAAAAVLLLAAGTWYFMKQQAPLPHASITQQAKVLNMPNTAAQGPEKREEDTKTNKNTVGTNQPSFIEQVTSPVSTSPEVSPIVVVQTTPVAIPASIDTVTIAQIEIATERYDSSTVTSNEKSAVPISKKRSLSYKLLQNSRTMLANLQLPDVKFKTEKKANSNIPKVKMEIHAYKTDVIATLID